MKLASALVVGWPLAFATPALAQDEASAPSAEELRAAREELDAVREELSATRAALEADSERRRAELEALREELGRLAGRAPSEVRPTRGDRVGYGETVRVATGERVQEVVAFGNDVHVEGEVVGDATSFGGSVYVGEGGLIEGDAISFGGRVHVADGGVVEGGRIVMGVPGVSTTPAEPRVEAAGSIVGLAGADLLGTVYRRLVLFLSFAGAGVLVVGLFPKRVSRIADALEESPIRSAAVGALGSGFLALFSLLFAIVTFGLGLPVSLVVWGMLGLAWLLGFVGLCQAVGDRLPFEQKPHGRWLAFLVGTMLVTCVGSLPWVGWLVVGGASMVGIGAALSSRFGGR